MPPGEGTKLTGLPDDILTTLPSYLDSLDDLHAVVLSSRRLYTTCSAPVPPQIARLARLAHPQPNIFIAVRARALARWAGQNAANETRLHSAVRSGPESILQLALEATGPLTLQDLAHVRYLKRDILRPVRVKMPWRMLWCSEPSLTNWLIYCDLFRMTPNTVRMQCNPATNMQTRASPVLIDWLRYGLRSQDRSSSSSSSSSTDTHSPALAFSDRAAERRCVMDLCWVSADIRDQIDRRFEEMDAPGPHGTRPRVSSWRKRMMSEGGAFSRRWFNQVACYSGLTALEFLLDVEPGRTAMVTLRETMENLPLPNQALIVDPIMAAMLQAVSTEP